LQNCGEPLPVFDMLLDVRNFYRTLPADGAAIHLRKTLSLLLVGGTLFAIASHSSVVGIAFGHYAKPAQTSSPLTTVAMPQAAAIPRPGLNLVVLDPAHGGIDPGARGTGGIRESELTLAFVAQIRRALESQGLQVVQTRAGNEDPSFDDRSAIANAQRGAVFVTVHIASTGLPGTARVYVNSDMPSLSNPTGVIPWDQAQAPFLALSRKLGDTVQALLAQQFRGSPTSAQTAPVRQLRTTAAPAIAVEISSVAVEKHEDLDRMAPGVADAIARGVIAFKPSYVLAASAASEPFAQPVSLPLSGAHP
jgi:N-acetylmuramoyl-L-alanine amidase